MIDIHTHLHPPRLFAAIRRWFAERSPWVLDHPTEPAAVAAALRAHGVERFVFCSYAHKPGMARDINVWLAATARDLDRYGLALATVHPGDPDPVADMRAALDDGCIGLKLHEDVQRLAIDDERLSGVLAAVAERRGFVLAHVGPIPWDMRSQGGPDRVARVLERHPGLRLVIAHLGAPDTAAYVALFARYPTLFIDTTMVLAASSPSHAAVDPALFREHADRFVLGTDFPNIPYAYDEERRGLDGLGLEPAVVRAIAYDNAARLLEPFA